MYLKLVGNNSRIKTKDVAKNYNKVVYEMFLLNHPPIIIIEEK